MRAMKCQNCGSGNLKKENGFWVCQYCGTRNYFTEDEMPAKESDINLGEDVRRLLQKWDRDPANAKKYAQLILQIDPHNHRALAELRKSASSGCYIATAVYGSYDCPEVWTLRRFRDDVLAKTYYGRLFIKVYYFASPTVVRLFGTREWFTGFWKRHLDKMVHNLNSRGFESSPYRDKNGDVN